jgi:tRNA 2-thiouridine synthesizing protein A
MDMTTLDVRGLVCPYPTSRTVVALAKLSVGETLEVISDYYPARSTIPMLASEPKYSYEFEEIDDRTFRFQITRNRDE